MILNFFILFPLNRDAIGLRCLPNFFCLKLHVAIPVEGIGILFVLRRKIVISSQIPAVNLNRITCILSLANVCRILIFFGSTKFSNDFLFILLLF